MNKSIITNLSTLIITIYGTFSPFYSAEIFMAGLFGLSGGLTNWLAIHMLFERVPFLFGSGVIPLRFKEFKEGIRNLIMHEFFSSKSLENFSNQKNFSTNQILDKINYDEIFKKLVEAIRESSLGSMLEMVGGEKALEPLRDPLKKKIKETIDELVKDNLQDSESLSQNFKNNIELLIDSRLNELSPEQVKSIIKDIIHKHLGWLVVWGGVFGFIIGLLLGFLGNLS
tara:strand:+ start:811 stop:1491 length:681 start_codon:yes stop_codon:yes gene_type:complete